MLVPKNHKFHPINGFTKAQIIETIQTRMLDHRSTLSEEGLGTCAYRAPDGNRCAVGVFIPDALYNRDMEGQSALMLTMRNKELAAALPLEPKALELLQTIHDEDSYNGDPRPRLIAWVNANVADEEVSK